MDFKTLRNVFDTSKYGPDTIEKGFLLEPVRDVLTKRSKMELPDFCDWLSKRGMWYAGKTYNSSDDTVTFEICLRHQTDQSIFITRKAE